MLAKIYVIDHVRITVDKGVNINVAIHAAALLALTEDRIVHFSFNGNIYTVSPAEIINALTENTKAQNV